MVALGLFQVYPKVKRDEALVKHGTEFPFSEAQQFGVLHQQFEITDNVSLKFELVRSLLLNHQRNTGIHDDNTSILSH